MNECPCGTGIDLDRCCGLFLDGRKEPTTAEQLMRARYTAHTCAKMDFVKATHHPDTVADFDESSAQTWAEESEWLGLEILAVEDGQASDESATVEFVARFNDADGTEREHHEVSTFDKVDGCWRFRAGDAPRAAEPYRRTQARIGRNDPCHCGSGKKFKKCCG
jgi:SEC-C motif-containing protein